MRLGESFGIGLGCILLFTSGVFADAVQDSLFEKALDAEDAGNVVQTVSLLEQASAHQGRYSEEIQQILSQYYVALGVSDSVENEESKAEKNLHFVSRTEFVWLKYKEFGDALSANEKSGEGYLQLGVEYEIRHGSISHYLMASISADAFLREDSTVFDTSRWALAPSLEYTLLGDRFLASIGGEVSFSKRDDAIVSGFISLEKDFYSTENVRIGTNAFGFVNENWRVNAKVGGYYEYRPKLGFWTNVSLAGRFERDTSVNSYYWRVEWMQNQEDWHWGVEEETFTLDSTRVQYYYGSNIKLGPELDLQLGYRFNKIFSVDFLGFLFWSFSTEADWWLDFSEEPPMGEDRYITPHLHSWKRRILQGSAKLRGNLKFENFGTYLSVGTQFRRYLDLPEKHPEIYSFAYILGEIRLGATFRF